MCVETPSRRASSPRDTPVSLKRTRSAQISWNAEGRDAGGLAGVVDIFVISPANADPMILLAIRMIGKEKGAIDHLMGLF